MGAQADVQGARAIKIAILAMGGEGGGVLADWIVSLAESGDYLAQLTSVPGVAQRTGATIYYLELFPEAAVVGDRAPVLALMPVPGDVDIVIASELLEAARAVERGLVTPDRTVLIASTHRVFSMTEKTAMGDGRLPADTLIEACRTAARHLIAFDMSTVAESAGSVISAVLFGALAKSRALPFDGPAFAHAIRRGGTGVEASLRAFELAQRPAEAPPIPEHVSGKTLHINGMQEFPEEVAEVAWAGYRRLADYQDGAYADLYLTRLKPIRELDRRHGDGSWRLLRETARYLALGMSYEDTVRVAELKIRPERLRRVRSEAAAGEGEVLEVVEYLHPRLEEIADTMPAPLGRFLLGNSIARRIVTALTARGRTVKTTSVTGHLILRSIAGLKRWRRGSLRFRREQEDLEDWLARIAALAPEAYDLAVEIAEARNLVKGYGSTHERGRASYRAVLAAGEKLKTEAGAARHLAELRAAALSDDTGEALKVSLGRLGLAETGSAGRGDGGRPRGP